MVELPTVEVFEIGNVTFLYMGCAADYCDARHMDPSEAIQVRHVREGISHRANFTRVKGSDNNADA